MELQWPLILFTTLLAWSAGLFASQAVLALRGEARKSQTTAWVVAAVLLVASGISVFFHLEHWERIFNGFGHLTSGITQELIAIVVLAVVAVIYLVLLRRSGDGTVPKWIAWAAIAMSAILVVVCGHSYMMPARPAWDSVLEVLSLVGAACALGPLTLAAIMAVRGDDLAAVGLPAVAGTAIGAVCAAAFAAFLQASGGSFAQVGFYFDPTHPTAGMADAAGAAASQAPLLWGGAVLLGAVVPLVLAVLAKRKGDAASWKLMGGIGAACALAGAVILRVSFYALGASVFMFY